MAFVSSIQKEWITVETTNFSKTIIQIIRYFKFMKGLANNNILQVISPSSI